MIKVKISKFHNDCEGNFVRGMEDASLKTILAPFKDAKRVLRYKKHPVNTSLVYMRNYLRLLGIWPRGWQGEYLYYRIINKFIYLLVAIFALTITCDLYEATKDIILFGDDLVVLIGVYLVSFKLILCFRQAKDIEEIIEEFQKMHYYFGHLKNSASREKIRKLQRFYFVAETFSFCFFLQVILLFTAATTLPPLITDSGGTPFRAKFPFEWNDFNKYPLRFSCIYIFQTVMAFFVLLSIMIMDNIGCHPSKTLVICNRKFCWDIFTQITLNLKIFCIRIRELGTQPGADYLRDMQEAVKFHQYIISLTSKINTIFYWNYVAQMGASTFMICLTAFEAMLAKDQPMIAIRYQMFMFSAFAQLLYWCASGNMVYYTSMDVADAAYEIERWYEQSKEFKYCLKFLIRRAQKPLVFRPKPFFGFNFESFTSILSTSYSYFALLRTMSD